jgi:hypothetical protein
MNVNRSRESMILLLSVAALGAAVWWALRWWPTERRTDEIGRVVVQAYGGEWATRFGITSERLSAALFAGANAALLHRIDHEVGVVDLRFDGDSRGNTVATTVIVTYNGDTEHSTAKLTLAWDDVPHTVRADLLRHSGDAVFRKWRAVA